MAVALLVAVLAVLPNLYAMIAAPIGARYLGVQYNTDDHMVYAAWARQAMDGAFLFDNRFTTDEQPGLTVHLYYFVLGQFARFLGIPLAFAVSRFVFTALFVWLAYCFIRRIFPYGYGAKLALTITIFGGGIGYLTWHMFGQQIVRPAPQILRGVLQDRLPVDVWQPEGFVFPSMLTSSLFMVSLCLILVVFSSFLDARGGWRPVLIGTLALGVLMNVHSYDVLLIGLVMLAFLATTMIQRQLTWPWLVRGFVIGLGAVPAALWFLYVLRHDPVFQARAATETFSPNFRQVLFGYFGLILLGMYGIAAANDKRGAAAFLAPAGIAALLLVGYVFAAGHAGGYWMGPAIWILVFLMAVGVAVIARTDTPAINLVVTWAVVGLVAVYFPALFQRKLAMGLSVPWAILAGCGAASLLTKLERGQRNLVALLIVPLLCGTSILWTFRQRNYINSDVSNTTVHPVYLPPDVVRIVEHLSSAAKQRRIVVLAMPGIPSPSDVPDTFFSPLIPDLNPIVSGLAGVYTFAGHWSETPRYTERRGRLTRFFLQRATDQERRELLEESQARYIVAPSPEAFADIGLPLADLTSLGTVVVDGARFDLIRL